MECGVCNRIKQPTKEVKRPCFPCDFCKRLICSECSSLSASELKCVTMLNRNLIFHCKNCRENDIIQLLNDRIKDKEVIIEDKSQIIDLLKHELEQFEMKLRANLPYVPFADVVKNPTRLKRIDNFPEIIIKPKEPQEDKVTKEEINKSIDPKVLKIGIKQFRVSKAGAVVVKCQTKDETQLLKEEIIKKLQDKYDVNYTKMRKPRIKIISYGQDLKEKEIEESIVEQNNLPQGSITVKYVRKEKSGLKTIFCECSIQSFHKIMAEKRIFIGWERLLVYEDLDIPRCYRCQGFYHKSNNCRNKTVCPVCSEEHEQRQCTKRKKCCKNCATSNELYKTSYNTEHHAADSKCSSLDYHKKMLRNKTCYNE